MEMLQYRMHQIFPPSAFIGVDRKFMSPQRAAADRARPGRSDNSEEEAMRTTTACGVGLLAAAALALASGTARANDYSYPYFKDVYNKGIYGYGGPDTYDLIIGSLYG